MHMRMLLCMHRHVYMPNTRLRVAAEEQTLIMQHAHEVVRGRGVVRPWLGLGLGLGLGSGSGLGLG